MISIRRSLEDLERVERLRQLASEGYANAIISAGEYAIELDPLQAAELRRNLRLIREQLGRAKEAEDFQAVQASFRGELRQYRDQSAEWLERLQRDLQSATLVMESLTHSVSANGVDHEKKLEADLAVLASIERSSDLAHVKKVVRQAASSIGESWEQLRRANQLALAQLHDEIRSLHREIETERRAQFIDTASGAWNRKKVMLRIEEDLNRDESFCVVLASIRDLKRLSAGYSGPVIEGALKALVKRIQGVAGKETMVGRWSEDQFAILLEIDPAQAVPIAKTISEELSGRYSIQERGVSRSLTLRIDTAIIDRPAGVPAEKFRERLASVGAPEPA